MKNSKYTPGPWRAVPYTRQDGLRIWQEGSNFDIAKVTPMPYHTGTDIVEKAHTAREVSEQGQANARLIAAAPELLEALKSAEQDLLTFDAESLTPGIFGKIKSAIAKAEGR